MVGGSMVGGSMVDWVKVSFLWQPCSYMIDLKTEKVTSLPPGRGTLTYKGVSTQV